MCIYPFQNKFYFRSEISVTLECVEGGSKYNIYGNSEILGEYDFGNIN